MSRVRNADDFLLRFREIQQAYEYLFSPRITQIRRNCVGKQEESILSSILEAHLRVYLVNALLAALNWRMDQKPEDNLPNLIPEVPVRSEGRGSIRFLDYLGIEKQTDNPLLIVETKRPEAGLPTAFNLASTHMEVVAKGLAGESLKGEWNKWLEDLKDYVRSIFNKTEKIPKRVVITNGDWLIVFLDPCDAFLQDGEHDPARIFVFLNKDDIESRSHELFLQLEYSQVSKEILPLTPVELPFFADGTVIDRVMHGLRLGYADIGLYKRSPVIIVAPIVFIHSRFGCWLQIEMPSQEFELPYERDSLPLHLNVVANAARSLLKEVNKCLGTSLLPFPLSKYYEDDEEFYVLRGVVEYKANEYLLVTGDKTHYLLPTPSLSGCPYHDWTQAQLDGVASNPGPVMIRSVQPRSFFISAELHHCAHRDVSLAKSAMITKENRSRCGSRSGLEGQAFCEIWRFENHLCCRTCAFEEVCTKAPVFRLPCRRIDNQ